MTTENPQTYTESHYGLEAGNIDIIKYLLDRAERCLVPDGDDTYVADSDDYLCRMDADAVARLRRLISEL